MRDFRHFFSDATISLSHGTVRNIHITKEIAVSNWTTLKLRVFQNETSVVLIAERLGLVTPDTEIYNRKDI